MVLRTISGRGGTSVLSRYECRSASPLERSIGGTVTLSRRGLLSENGRQDGRPRPYRNNFTLCLQPLSAIICFKQLAPQASAGENCGSVTEEPVVNTISAKATSKLSTDVPVILSRAEGVSDLGFGFRSWRYATAAVGLTKDGPKHEVCLDSGCTMTLIDCEFMKNNAPRIEI